jgi:hypothetical protein
MPIKENTYESLSKVHLSQHAPQIDGRPIHPGIACMTSSAQTLTLDNFTKGSYTTVLKTAQSTDTHL